MPPPIVQIYTMQSVAEATAVAALGIDRIGVTPARRGLPGEVAIEDAAAISAAVRGAATVCALSVESDFERIAEMVARVVPDVLHLCGPPGATPPEEIPRLRSRLSEVDIMQAVAVEGEEAIAAAAAYAPVVDCLILDSIAGDVEGIGAAGVVHDWDISRRIVDEVDVPVILAGGLSPENVADAVAAVGPWGVDSLTHTNARRGSTFIKDIDRVGQFAAAARGAWSAE